MSVRIRVFDSRIHAMSLPGGMIYRWGAQVTREVADLARVTAPIARQDWGHGMPGRLKASHKHSVGANAIGVFGTVTNTAPYAKFVHEGTSTPITPKTYPYMKFSINGRTFRKQEVRGQSAQPWLSDAMLAVMARHGI